MKFFVGNPPKRRKAKKRRTAAQRRATAKMLRARKASLRKDKAGPSRRRKPSIRRKRSVPMATTKRRKSKKRAGTRRRRSTTARKAPRRRRRSVVVRRARRRSVYRSNPGIVNSVMQGAKDAAFVFAGRTVAGMVAQRLPNLVGGPTGLTVNKLATGVLLGLVARKAMGNDAARFVVAGAFGSVIEDLARRVLPAGTLAAYPRMAAYPRLAAYPRVSASVASSLSGYTMQQASYDAMGIPTGG